MSDQIKVLVKEKAKETKASPQVILRMVIFEFFLEKLSQSRFINHMIIKGGFLISAITHIQMRTTIDLDISIKSLSIEESSLRDALNEILHIPTRPDLYMELIHFVTIRESASYGGLRAFIKVEFAGIKDSLKIDFTTGDVITPKEEIFQYKTILTQDILKIKGYNLETLLAEKLETILSRASANTRMRDFFDVYILWQFHQATISVSILKNALIKTISNRNSIYPTQAITKEILNQLMTDANMRKLWRNYQRDYPYAEKISWDEMIKTLTTIFLLFTH